MNSLINYIKYDKQSSIKATFKSTELENETQKIESSEASIEILNSKSTSEKKLAEYQDLISRLEQEKLELTSKLKMYQKKTNDSDEIDGKADETSTDNSEASQSLKDLQAKLDQSQKTIDVFKEQISQLNTQLNEMNNIYETTKQSELDERNKIKHLDRSVRALKLEKEQMVSVC